MYRLIKKKKNHFDCPKSADDQAWLYHVNQNVMEKHVRLQFIVSLEKIFVEFALSELMWQ